MNPPSLPPPRGSAQPLRHQAVLLFCLGTASVLTLPLASGCQKQEAPPDEIRNCDIPALFAAKCSGALCHSSDSAQGDLDLLSPGVERRLFHVESTTACGKEKLVDPGSPARSLLYQKVTQSPPPCGETMPPNRVLSESEVACLRTYIERAGVDADGTKCETCGGILCVDFARDPKHCGSCGATCNEGQVCGGGQCVNPCAEDETLCGAACVSVLSNDDHCGRCGHRCAPGSSCVAGACSCDAGGSGTTAEGGGTALPESAPIPSFQNEVLPLFENACAGSDCHTGGERKAPLGLDPGDAYGHLVNVTAQDCGSQLLVVPSSPDNSYLIDKLMGGNLCAGSQMPLSAEPLPNAALSTIVHWICAGAPDN